MTSQVEENYLKAIFHLSTDEQKVSISAISKELDVSKPSCNSMVKNLQDKGLLNYEKYKPLTLTERGRKVAALIVRKHRLTEMYLVNKMGFGWEEVHEIAEQIEHIKSPSFFERMDELLDHPKLDPHGSPIPDKEGKVISPNYRKLLDCKKGELVKLISLNNSSKEFLEFLDSRDLHLGRKLEVINIEPFDQSVTISYDHRNESLSALVAERLLVE